MGRYGDTGCGTERCLRSEAIVCRGGDEGCRAFPAPLSPLAASFLRCASDRFFSERVDGPWFRLAAETIEDHRDARGVENAYTRQSVLLAPEGFAAVFDKLESIGNVFKRLGKPGGELRDGGYAYAPFH